jgi:hypothetical protein
MILIGWSGYAFAVSIADDDNDKAATRAPLKARRIDGNMQGLPMIFFMAISYA